MHNPQDPTHTQDLRLTGHSEVLLRYGEYSRYVESALDQVFGKVIITNVELSDLDDVSNEEELYELLILLFGEKAIEFILEEDERAEWFLSLLGVSYFRGRIVAQNQLKPTVVNNPACHARK